MLIFVIMAIMSPLIIGLVIKAKFDEVNPVISQALNSKSVNYTLVSYQHHWFDSDVISKVTFINENNPTQKILVTITNHIIHGPVIFDVVKHQYKFAAAKIQQTIVTDNPVINRAFSDGVARNQAFCWFDLTCDGSYSTPNFNLANDQFKLTFDSISGSYHLDLTKNLNIAKYSMLIADGKFSFALLKEGSEIANIELGPITVSSLVDVGLESVSNYRLNFSHITATRGDDTISINNYNISANKTTSAADRYNYISHVIINGIKIKANDQDFDVNSLVMNASVNDLNANNMKLFSLIFENPTIEMLIPLTTSTTKINYDMSLHTQDGDMNVDTKISRFNPMLTETIPFIKALNINMHAFADTKVAEMVASLYYKLIVYPTLKAQAENKLAANITNESTSQLLNDPSVSKFAASVPAKIDPAKLIDDIIASGLIVKTDKGLTLDFSLIDGKMSLNNHDINIFAKPQNTN